MKLNNKKNIVVFIDWYLPAYLAGGPVQSIASLVEQLQEEFNFYIITSAKDLDGSRNKGIITNTWNGKSGCKVYYFENPPTFGAVRNLLKTTPFDAIYLNSLFSLSFTIKPLVASKFLFRRQPVIVAPRGMLAQGALSLKKSKKALFIFIARAIGLYRKVIWHATSDIELNEIRKVFGDNNKSVTIPNLPKAISEGHLLKKKKGFLKVVSIARISKVKNLLFALKCLRSVRQCQVQFDIYGPLESIGYWEQCKLIIDEMPDCVEVNYKGTLMPSQIELTIKENHILFLPTMGENYGHTIVESLLCSRPVVISDRTPWKDLEEHGAGFALPLGDEALFLKALYHYCEMDDKQFGLQCRRARSYMEFKADIVKIKGEYVRFFNGL